MPLDDGDFAARVESAGRQVCARLGIDPARWKEYSSVVEEELVRHEIKSLLRETIISRVKKMIENDDEEVEPCI